MNRIKTAMATLALLALVGQERMHDTDDLWRDRVEGVMKEELMVLEYTPAADEVAIKFSAESEAHLVRIEMRAPSGERVLQIQADEGGKRSLSGFKMETREYHLNELFETYMPGRYEIRARLSDGRVVRGSALLSLELLPEPLVMYPAHGATGIPTSFLAVWVPDPEAVGYRIGLEQGDTDTMIVNLPAGARSFRVPPGVLESDTETYIEVAAIGRSGNETVVEVVFFTR